VSSIHKNLGRLILLFLQSTLRTNISIRNSHDIIIICISEVDPKVPLADKVHEWLTAILIRVIIILILCLSTVKIRRISHLNVNSIGHSEYVPHPLHDELDSRSLHFLLLFAARFSSDAVLSIPHHDVLETRVRLDDGLEVSSGDLFLELWRQSLHELFLLGL